MAAGKWTGTTTLIISRSSRDTAEEESADPEEASASNQRADRKPRGSNRKAKATAVAGSKAESSPHSTADWTTLTFDLFTCKQQQRQRVCVEWRQQRGLGRVTEDKTYI